MGGQLSAGEHLDTLGASATTMSLQTVGRLSSFYTLVAVSILGVVLLLGGLYFFFFHRFARSADVQGVVQSEQCDTGQRDMSCALAVHYTVNGTQYAKNLLTSTRYLVGDRVDLRFNPMDPLDVEVKSNYFKYMSLGAIFAGVFLPLAFAVQYDLVHKSPAVAVAAAVGAAVGVFLSARPDLMLATGAGLLQTRA